MLDLKSVVNSSANKIRSSGVPQYYAEYLLCLCKIVYLFLFRYKIKIKSSSINKFLINWLKGIFTELVVRAKNCYIGEMVDACLFI